MESSHEIILADQYGSSLQVSGESGFLSQNPFEFQTKKKSDSVSEDETSVSEFEEEEEAEDIANKEDYVKTEEVFTLQPNLENEKKDELCIGMEFSSDEAAHKAYKKFGGKHGFNVRKQRRKKKNDKLSVVITNPTLQMGPFSSQVLQLSVATTNTTLQTGPFSSQVL